MESFIPAEYYSDFYHHFMLIIALIIFLESTKNISSTRNLKSKNFLGIFLFLLVLFFIGFRPVSVYFGDMGNYYYQFYSLVNGDPPKYSKDFLFIFFMNIISSLESVTFFFFLCAFLYLYPLFSFTKKVFNQYWFYAFFMLIISFSFWSYGTNGIRNGIASSLFLLGISIKKKSFKYIMFIVACGFHQSILLPFMAYLMTNYYNYPKKYLIAWLCCIPLSLVIGNLFISFFLNLGIIETNNLEGYLGDFDYASEGITELKTGFRWDFLLYSASGVLAGWYYIFKKSFTDPFYYRLYNIYLIVNGLWILVIKANYSNRFAYLSWFMLAIIIIYPLLKKKIFRNQNRVLAVIILAYFSFTYLMNVILS